MMDTRKRLPAEERKKQIRRCAAEVFARSNYSKAKVADIAAQAGISEAMVYKHFPSKKDIFIEVLQHMSERTVFLLQEEVTREPDALKAMKNMATTYYNMVVDHADEVKVHFQAISEICDNDIAERLHQDQDDYMRFIRDLVDNGVRQGSFREDLDVDSLVLLLDGVGVFMNLMKLLSFEEQFTEQTVTRMVDHLIDYMRA